ncbi:MAG: catechol 2,3-dioxygenase-like lactoylglutathione lyase family enzyme [Candidatus Aldehydirespiratoraceae bacterium]|jgi:catechol 2,3-dioxygenase-like lactoylglutathione lyase family enzyme
MGINHLAIAVKDMAATHRFYTDSMGFELVKTEIVPKDDGFARHAFYSTGDNDGQLIAFWDLASDKGAGEFSTDICRDLGLDPLTNHIAFQADDLDDIAEKKQRWLDGGLAVLEIDHGWIHSIYTEDPDGIAVEFAVMTRPFSETDRAEAEALLFAIAPEPSPEVPYIVLHQPDQEPTVLSGEN